MNAAWPPGSDYPVAAMGADPEGTRSRRIAICRMLLAFHRMQAAAFAEVHPAALRRSLSAGTSQVILLDLYLAALENRQVYQSCLAPSEPPATVHRQAARLERMGAVLRAVDAHDQRRLNVALTPMMRSALDLFIDAADEAFRLGAPSAL